MTLSKEALDLIGACETFMAFLQRNGSTQTDRDMAIFYAHALRSDY